MSEFIDKLTEPLLMQSYSTLFFITFLFCGVIIFSAGYGFNKRAEMDKSAVQNVHEGFVPRVGGLAIYLSIFSFIPLSNSGFIPLSILLDLKVNEMLWLVFSAFPVFLIGFAEDLGFLMSPLRRLLASLFSSSIVIFIFEVWVSNVGIPGFNFLLSIAPLGIAFTLFATAGVVNGFNLIDGLNGLSSYVAISTALSLSMLAFNVGNFEISIFLILISAAVFGFMVLNFPFGKIFLGDAGAYMLGHLLVWSAIILINLNPEISPFAILLIFFWPVADTGLAIWRRWKWGNSAGRPDRLHFHQLAMRFLELKLFGRKRRHVANPVATVFLVPFISVPQTLGLLYWHDVSNTIWYSIVMSLLFLVTYLLGINIAKKAWIKS